MGNFKNVIILCNYSSSKNVIILVQKMLPINFYLMTPYFKKSFYVLNAIEVVIHPSHAATQHEGMVTKYIGHGFQF